MKYLYTRGFREPNFESLYSKTKIVGSETYSGVNPDPTDPNAHAPYKLEPEKSQAHEGQIFYNILSDLRANVNLAHTKVSGLINTYYDNGKWRWRRNLGEQVANTIEFELQKNFYITQLGIEPGSFIYFNSTYNDTYRISSELNARTTFEQNSLGNFLRKDGVFYPVGTKLRMTEVPQKWMNFGGYVRFLERWGFNYNVFAASERRVGGYKGFEENADPDQKKIGVGIKKYPENYKEEVLAAAACSYSREPVYSCGMINNGNYQYRLSPYYTLDLGLHYETIFQDDQRLRLSVQEKNVLNRLYSEADQTTTGRILPNFQPGRNIIISLQYQF